MGKCSICRKRIEYNSFRVVDNKIYCMKCVPKEEEIVAKAPEYAAVEEQKIPEANKLVKTIKDSGVSLDELAAALGEVAPKRKRSRKKNED